MPALALFVGLALACAAPSGIHPRGLPEDAVPIDLGRFMGAWFVVAHIPTSVEENAYEAVERYALEPDGTIAVQFEFCEGGLGGPRQELTMTGWVYDPSTNAEWRVRPFWPLRLAYQILELDPDYTLTVIGHPSGDYAWVMARQPEIDEVELAAITARLDAAGYETDRLRLVPHADGACRDGPPQ